MIEHFDWGKANNSGRKYTKYKEDYIVYSPKLLDYPKNESDFVESYYTATSAETIKAYNAITNNGKISDFSHNVLVDIACRLEQRTKLDGRSFIDWVKVGRTTPVSLKGSSKTSGILANANHFYSDKYFEWLGTRYPTKNELSHTIAIPLVNQNDFRVLSTSPERLGLSSMEPVDKFKTSYFGTDTRIFRMFDSFGSFFGLMMAQLWPFTKGDLWYVTEFRNVFHTDSIDIAYSNVWSKLQKDKWQEYCLWGRGQVKGEYFLKLVEALNNYIDCTTDFVECVSPVRTVQNIRLSKDVSAAMAAEGTSWITIPAMEIDNDVAEHLCISENMAIETIATLQSHFDVFIGHINRHRTNRSFILSTNDSLAMSTSFDIAWGIADQFTAFAQQSDPASIMDNMVSSGSIPMRSPDATPQFIDDAVKTAILATLQCGFEVYGNLLSNIPIGQSVSLADDSTVPMLPIFRALLTSHSNTLSSVVSSAFKSMYSLQSCAWDVLLGQAQPEPFLLRDSISGMADNNVLNTDETIHICGADKENDISESALEIRMSLPFVGEASVRLVTSVHEPVTSYRIIPDSAVTIPDYEEALMQRSRSAPMSGASVVKPYGVAVGDMHKSIEAHGNGQATAIFNADLKECKFATIQATGEAIASASADVYIQRIKAISGYFSAKTAASGAQIVKHGAVIFGAGFAEVHTAANARTIRGLRHLRSTNTIRISTMADADCSLYISAIGSVCVSDAETGQIAYQKPIVFDAKTTIQDSESALAQFADRISAEANAKVTHLTGANLETNITLNAAAAMPISTYMSAVLDKELPEGWINPRYVDDDVLLVRQIHYTFSRYNLLYLDSLVARDTWARPVLRLNIVADLAVANIYHPDVSKWIRPVQVDSDIVIYQTHRPWQKKDTAFVDSALPLPINAVAREKGLSASAEAIPLPPVYIGGSTDIRIAQTSDTGVHSDQWVYPQQRIRTLVIYQLHSAVQDENSLEVI